MLRSWYARLPAVVQNAHSLVRQTEECAKAFRQGEVPLPEEVQASGACKGNAGCRSNARSLRACGVCCHCPVSTLGMIPLLGQYLTSYWEQKKRMAPGCEPLAVRRMMDVLAPYVHGQSLAGAGGGGFLYLLTKEPQQKEVVEAVLAKTEVTDGVGFAAGGGKRPVCLTRAYPPSLPGHAVSDFQEAGDLLRAP